MTARRPPRARGNRNEFAGTAETVVQAGGVHGSLHVHQASGTAVPIPRQLPADTAYFTGREGDLTWLDSRLVDGATEAASRVAVITGAAGVGKTALALRWAHRVRDRFPDGDLYVNLHGYGRGTPIPLEQVVERFLRALGVPSSEVPADAEAQADLCRSLQAGRRLLIVLDNASSAEQVRPLLPGSSTCFVVVTSRHHLTGLRVQPGAERRTVIPLSTGEAVSLVREVIGVDRVDAEPQAAGELARLCACLPLALRIAADRVATHPHTTLAELVDELAVERDRLDLLATDDDVIAVRAAFSWSYQALAGEAAEVFRLLGLHAGVDVSIHAAAALVAGSVAEVRPWLDALAGVHLLEEVDRDRYRFHDLLRVYAAELAEAEVPAGDRAAAVRRVLEWYLRTADVADRWFSPQRRHVPLDAAVGVVVPDLGSHSGARKWCEVERANLVAATRQAAETGNHDVAWKLPVALWGYFTIRTPWADWIATYRAGLASARLAGARLGEAWILSGLGTAYRDLRRYDDALEAYDLSLVVWREIGDLHGEGWTLGSKGIAYWELARFDEALTCSRAAITAFRTIGNRHGEGLALHCVGESCRGLGRLDEAHEYLHRALVLRREIRDRWGEGQTSNSLGDTYRDLGRPDAAVERYRDALAVWTETGDQWGEARTLTNLGDVSDGLGLSSEAREYWARSLAICEELGSPMTGELRARLEG